MDKIGTQLGNFGVMVEEDSIHLNMHSDQIYYLSTWSIRKFSTIQKVLSKEFDCMDNFKYLIYLRHDKGNKRITIKCVGSYSDYVAAYTNFLKFHVAIVTDSGTVLFNQIVCNSRPFLSSFQCLFCIDVTGEDYKNLEHLPNDTFILTFRIKRPSIGITSAENFVTRTSLRNDIVFLDVISNEVVNLCVDHERVIVNKGLLCARSSVFAMMFQNDMREQRENKVIITDIKMAVVRALVSYLYYRVVPDGDLDFYCELYYAADKYNVIGLLEECIRLLLCKISHENILRVLKLSVMHNDERLKSAVLALIGANIDTIKMTPDWNNFSLDDPDLALKASTLFDF